MAIKIEPNIHAPSRKRPLSNFLRPILHSSISTIIPEPPIKPCISYRLSSARVHTYLQNKNRSAIDSVEIVWSSAIEHSCCVCSYEYRHAKA